MIQSYKDFEVYKRSYKMALKVHQIVKSYPNDERFELVSQMKRASLSIPLNIAEGYGKKSSSAEFKRFLTMSLVSCNEMEVLIEFSKDLSYISNEVFETNLKEYQEIGKMINTLIERWK